MIIWSGFGFVVVIVAIACMGLTGFAVNAIMGDNHFDQTHGWPKLLGMVLAAAIIWPLGRAMNRGTERQLVDPDTGKPVMIRSGGGHSLFFIPVQYWSFIFLILGFLFVFMKK